MTENSKINADEFETAAESEKEDGFEFVLQEDYDYNYITGEQI